MLAKGFSLFRLVLLMFDFSNSLLNCQIVSVYKLNYNNHPIPYNSKFQIDIIFIVYKQIIRIVPFTHFKHFDVVLQSGFHGII